jgi:hypothetical protein
MERWSALQEAISNAGAWRAEDVATGFKTHTNKHWVLNLPARQADSSLPQPSVLVAGYTSDLSKADEAGLNMLLCLFRTWPKNYTANPHARWDQQRPFGPGGNPAKPNSAQYLTADLLYNGKDIYFQTWIDYNYPVVCRIRMHWVHALLQSRVMAFPFQSPPEGPDHRQALAVYQEVAKHFCDTIALLSMLLWAGTVPIHPPASGYCKSRRIRTPAPNAPSKGYDLGFYWAWAVVEPLLFRERWSWSDQFYGFEHAGDEENVTFLSGHGSQHNVSVPLQEVLLAKGRMVEDGSSLKAWLPDRHQPAIVADDINKGLAKMEVGVPKAQGYAETACFQT